MTVETFTVEDYFRWDYPHTLFPLRTTGFLINEFSQELKEFVYNNVLAGTDGGFPPQLRCYAAKRGYNLRRTIKLDPAAEYFLYDIIFRNRQTFRRDFRQERKSFGYRFSRGRPETTTDSYAAFKSDLASARYEFDGTLKVDVATYFNSIYHHDLVDMARDIKWADADVNHLGRFFREINAGRSVDCLPQGIHPAKVLGTEFLRFVDNSYKLKAKLILRFLDDIHLFDDDVQQLTSDLLVLQEIIGEKGLSLNDSKTSIGAVEEVDIPAAVDDIKRSLLRMRRETVVDYGDGVSEDIPPLDERETDYLLEMLENPDIDESDAELVLVLLRDHGEEVVPKIRELLEKYPGLTKNFFDYTRFTDNRDGIDDVVLEFLRNAPLATEFQMFWLITLAESFLEESGLYGNILTTAMDHPNATTLTRAKVLEIKESRFGLPELREQTLRSGASGWESWSAAVGMRGEKPGSRNHLLGYFGKGSPLNKLISDCVQRVP